MDEEIEDVHSSKTVRVTSGSFMSIFPKKSMYAKLSMMRRWRRWLIVKLYPITENLNDVSGIYRSHCERARQFCACSAS